MKDILLKQIKQNYQTIEEYIKKNCSKKEINKDIEEELLPELIIFLMEPFEGNSMEPTIKQKTLIKRKNEIENILNKTNTDFLKYCYRWLNNNMNWTYGNLFYRRNKLMSDDSLELYTEDNDDEKNNVFEEILQKYYSDNNLDEYLEDLNEEDEVRLTILRNVVDSDLEQWERNLYQLYFRDQNNLRQTSEIVGVSTTSIYNLVKKLKIKINMIVEKKYNNI